MEIVKPNLFIIGAPKCGTTSLAHWLAQHPAVYMSPVKEPQHFCTDFGYRAYRSRDEYLRLFAKAAGTHGIIGEASATYLYSRVAVPNIEREIPEARYIVLVRNPIEMAYALHEQLLFDGDENVADFESAWRLQERRRLGENIPRRCREASFLQYKQACSLGAQLQRLYDVAPRERILTLLLDDIKRDPGQQWKLVQRFLEIEEDNRAEFAVMNSAKEARLLSLRRVLADGSALRKKLGIPSLRGSGLIRAVDRLNTKKRERPPMSVGMVRELHDAFREDILGLEGLLGRNLRQWLT